jgi:cytosine/uracil/thiamine/allantoin permease
VVLIGGAPLRSWITAKLKVNPTPDPTKLFWKIWHRFGIWGLGLIAPVTVGPQATAAIALALGESPMRIQLAISLGVLPWTVAFALLTATGAHALK